MNSDSRSWISRDRCVPRASADRRASSSKDMRMTLVCGSEARGNFDYEMPSCTSQGVGRSCTIKESVHLVGGVLASTGVRARGMHAEGHHLVNPVENQRNCGHAACSRGLINRERAPANAYGAGQHVI